MMMRSAREQFIFVCIWALLFITHLMMIRTLVFMRRQMQEKQERELAVVSNHLLGQQFSMLENSVEEARRIRHDMRHHNMQIAQYVQKGCTDELLQYLGKYEKEAESHTVMTICESPGDGKTCSNTFEWCGDDVAPQINILQNISWKERQVAAFKLTADVLRPSMSQIPLNR